MGKHTSQPWKVVRRRTGTYVVSIANKDCPSGQVVATVSSGPGKNTEANADLIAAAPEQDARIKVLENEKSDLQLRLREWKSCALAGEVSRG